MAKRRVQESRDILKVYLDPSRIDEVTSIFKMPKDPGFEWSQQTADLIKERYRVWFEDWVKKHLEIVCEKRI